MLGSGQSLLKAPSSAAGRNLSTKLVLGAPSTATVVHSSVFGSMFSRARNSRRIAPLSRSRGLCSASLALDAQASLTRSTSAPKSADARLTLRADAAHAPRVKPNPRRLIRSFLRLDFVKRRLDEGLRLVFPHEQPMTRDLAFVHCCYQITKLVARLRAIPHRHAGSVFFAEIRTAIQV